MKRINKLSNNEGFTLIELMISLFISALIMGGVMVVNKSQKETYAAQLEVAQMQQNIRAGLSIMLRDLRMAGYDPKKTGVAGFITSGSFDGTSVDSDASQIAFTMDIDENGSIDSSSSVDRNGDGNVDMADLEEIAYRLNANGELQKYSSSTGAIKWQTIAENIEGLEFNYLNDTGAGSSTPGSTTRYVQVSILAQAENPDNNFEINTNYTTGAGNTWNVTGNLRRRFMITKIKCRNLGL